MTFIVIWADAGVVGVVVDGGGGGGGGGGGNSCYGECGAGGVTVTGGVD